MLTGDLLRYRIDGQCIRPRYITRRSADRGYLHFAQRLISLFQAYQGKSRAELDLALEKMEGERTDFKVFRGLAKLLLDGCDFFPRRDLDFPALRRKVFLGVQCHYPVLSRPDLLHKKIRDDIIGELAGELALLPDEITPLLYGDLPGRLILSQFNTAFTPETLLKRYNLALAQGLLYRCRNMRIQLKGDYRVVIQYLKLCRLMHWITPGLESGLCIRVDGPASLFCQTQRYGVRMATFLPGLLLAEEWEMTAEIKTDDGLAGFNLDSNCGLTTPYRPGPRFDSRIEERFFNKFNRKDRTWVIERETEIMDLGDTIFIPDFSFRHPDGRQAHLEIVGFWTPDYLAKKLDKIRRSDRDDLFLAVNNQLNCSREDFPGEVLFYRTGIKIGDVLDILERVAK